MTTPPVMSVTDELIAELEAKKAANWRTVDSVSIDMLCGLIHERAEYRRLLLEQERIMRSLRDSECALMNEVAELKRDAERYMAALTEAKYRIEQGRVWNGMGWTLTGLHPHGQQKALDAIDAAMTP